MNKVDVELRHDTPAVSFPFGFCTEATLMTSCCSVWWLLTVSVLSHAMVVGASMRNSVSSDWLLGVARVDISPSEPVWLGGFRSRNRNPTSAELSSADSLFARVLVLQDASQTLFADGSYVVLVSLDLIGIDEDFSNRIFAEALARHGVKRESLRLCFSHTHSGPIVGDNLHVLAPSDTENRSMIDRYKSKLLGLVVDSVGEAMKSSSMISVRARFGIGACELAVNRREVSEKAYSQQRGFTHDEVPVLWFERSTPNAQNTEIVAGVYSYAAHATVLTSGYMYSGDYPGITSAMLERYGSSNRSVWLYVAGCGGDQNIYPRGTVETLRKHAANLTAVVQRVVTTGGMDIGRGMGVAHSFLSLPFRTATTRKELGRLLRHRDQDLRKMARYLLTNADLSVFADGSGALEHYSRYPISVWRVGSVYMAFLGGEPTVGFASILRRKSRLNWVCGYADNVMGYIPTRDVLLEGRGEGSDRVAHYYGLPSTWSANIDDIIVGAVMQLQSKLQLDSRDVCKVGHRRLVPFLVTGQNHNTDDQCRAWGGRAAFLYHRANR